MVTACVLALAVLAGACFEGRYRCARDSDCDRGVSPRCELDGFCSVLDPTCASERRYSEHSGERASQCFDDAIAIVNPCAPGQLPAVAEGCARTVCDQLPACCSIGWSEACVQQAQLACGLACDTRLAVTASRGGTVEHWELTWDGARWSATQRLDRDGGVIAWVGPAPGDAAPRLAGLVDGGTSLLVGETRLAADPERTYQSITSVDFDRAGRDTLAVGYQVGNTHFVELIDVATGGTRTFTTNGALRLAWGDRDRDAFPDGVAGRNNSYVLIDNVGAGPARAIEAIASSALGGGGTPGSPALRNLDWIDIDGDRQLDLVAFGNQIRVHADPGPLRDIPLITLDCEPPAPPGQCPEPEQQTQNTSFAGVALPGAVPAIVAAAFSNRTVPRAIYRITIDRGPPVRASARRLEDDCPACDPIIALVARDLDGDRELDVVGLDARLRVYTALSSAGGTFVTDPLPPRPTSFTNVVVSATGAPNP